MNCDHFQNELEDFLYGELGEARAAEMRAHLGNCAACAAIRDEIDRENDIFGRFYEQTSIEPAAEMWESIRARINSENPDRSRVENDRGLTGLSALLDRLRAARLPFAPATLRQAAFAALLVILSVAVTTIYLKLGEKKEANNLANEKAPQPPRPAPSPYVNAAGNMAAVNTNNGATTPKPVNRAAPPRRPVNRELAEQELVNRQIARAEREYQKAVRLLDQAIARQRDRLDPALIKQYESSLAGF
jgi:hypothetical protein